ncbi:MAG: citrate/2-methylcitrate synthase [Aquihabitans sp.]
MDAPRLTTAEAASRLGVKPETLYAYVSRGVIERHRDPGGISTYDPRDIERLARAGRRTKSLPPVVFPSSLTLIDGGRYSYRGAAALTAALGHRFEEVAEWLWTGAWPDDARWPFDTAALDQVLAAQAPLPRHCLPLDRYRVITAVAAAADPIRHDDRPEAVVPTARRLLRLLVHGLPRADGREARRAEPTRTMAEVLWTRLTRLPRTPERIALLDAALGLLADHELASSTFAARMAAMVRADVYEVVGAGLNVIGGLRHGGASMALEAVFRDAARFGVPRALDGRIGDGGRLAGFGHSLYPAGDPRATAVLERLPAIDPPGDRLATVEATLAELDRRGVAPPNVDAGLAALSFCADMPPGSGEAVFALARTAGWIGHALEQYDQPTFIRARVDYIGPRPPGPEA